MSQFSFEEEVLGFVCDDYETPVTITADIASALGRDVTQAEVRDALISLAARGRVQAYVFDKAANRYKVISAEEAATNAEPWFYAETPENVGDMDTLIPEMKEWNGGKGVDPEAWVGCEGNFRLMAAYTLMFWPEFAEHDGMILRKGFDPSVVEGFMKSCNGDKTVVEATMNHIHILDLHHVGCPDASRELVVYLGRVLREIYTVKLRSQFPGRRIVVEFDERDCKELMDYQLTFYQSRNS